MVNVERSLDIHAVLWAFIIAYVHQGLLCDDVLDSSSQFIIADQRDGARLSRGQDVLLAIGL